MNSNPVSPCLVLEFLSAVSVKDSALPEQGSLKIKEFLPLFGGRSGLWFLPQCVDKWSQNFTVLWACEQLAIAHTAHPTDAAVLFWGWTERRGRLWEHGTEKEAPIPTPWSWSLSQDEKQKFQYKKHHLLWRFRAYRHCSFQIWIFYGKATMNKA